jgi:hypothetical protein
VWRLIAFSGVMTAKDANGFIYSATIEIFDADGNLIFTACGRWTGTRFK